MSDHALDAFAPILNWRLLKGSHSFPGPDGGTCINEAAMVAAGLPYRAITATEDCPPCFSRPLAAYALGLNDAMPEAERQGLMAFVLRLSGSADAPAIEAARTAFLALESARRILPPLLDAAGLPALAARCETASDARSAMVALRAAEMQGGTLAHAAAGRHAWIAGARAAAASRTATAALRAFTDPRSAAEVAEGAAPFTEGTWRIALDILDGALGIGRQAPAIDLVCARDRLEAARTQP
ncbi:MAG TPA: hypothetical protein VGU70_15225 [Methylobacterium sp.]|uniref:hypothetical protein n=1 Tax=Methylorubrum sp. B1-46 TaxID=2897334 RepID=UPI001E57E823|nr:hypothetical protein [Methylorubrum sp. B1-46]UGB27401.1 hypothetical protein LPC10_07495 [Methylorubrum sp. B1-46]HEV2544109.1 hypothetical protein [Methylobacterium sp.]